MTNAELRKAAIREKARRAQAVGTKAAVDIDRAFHAPQARLVRAVVERKRRYIEANCGRQSGKSHGLSGATDLVASGTSGVNTLYVTKTFAACEKMAFKPARDLSSAWGLGGHPRTGRTLDITFPNGSTSYYMGADTDGTIEKLRGTPNLALVVIDEAGLYSPEDLQLMIEAVTPGLRPLAGTLVVAGTPSRAGKQGTWYDITQNPHFDHHYFTYRDNDRVPSFADVERLIDEELAMMFPDMPAELRRETAYFKREYLACFEVDLAEKVYALADACLVDDIPARFERHGVGGDLGSSANDALVAAGWDDDSADVYVVETKTAKGQDSIAFASMAKDFCERFNPLVFPVDPGGLGQKTINTARTLFPELPITEAVKPPIALQVRALNQLLRRLKIRRGSQLALELAGPTWVDGIVGGEINEHGKHSDLVPALRYLAIAILPLLPDPPAPALEGEEGAAAARREARLAEVRAEVARVERDRRTPAWVKQQVQRGAMTQETADEFLPASEEWPGDEL